MMMTLAELREELAGLHSEQASEVERDLHEVRLHSDRGAVVQVVACRPRSPLLQPPRPESLSCADSPGRVLR
jgi:hypothetical protein